MGKDLVHTRLDFIFGLYLIESEGVTVSASDEITENIKMAKRMDEQQHDPTRKRLERPRNQNKIDCRAADFVFELTPSPPLSLQPPRPEADDSDLRIFGEISNLVDVEVLDEVHCG